MTVTGTSNRAEWNGDGSTVLFSPTYKVFATSDFAVYLSGVLQTETTHYTVSLSGDPAGVDGADVTFVTAPPTGTANVVIVRSLPSTQGINLPTAGKFPSDTVEEGLDRAVMLLQDLGEKVGRAIVLPVESTLEDIAFLDPGAAKGFRWNEAGTALELVTILDDGTTSVIVAEGDVVRGSSGGIPERLVAGAAEALFKMGANAPAWFVKGDDNDLLQTISGSLAWRTPAQLAALMDLADVGTRAHGSLTGTGIDDHHARDHQASHGTGAADPFASTLVLEAIGKRIQTTDGPTTLLVGAIADGEGLQRTGSAIDGFTIPTAARTTQVLLPGAAMLGDATTPQWKRLVLANSVRQVLAFDGASDEFCFFQTIVPRGFLTTITARLCFRVNDNTASDQVRFLIQGVSITLDDSSDPAVSAGNVILTDSDTSAANDLILSAHVAFTPDGSPAIGELLSIRLTRTATHGDDDPVVDVELFSVELEYY